MRLLFLLLSSIEDRTTDAWTTPLSSLATTKNVATQIIRRCRRRPRICWDQPPVGGQRHTEPYGIARRRCASHLLLRVQSNDNCDGIDIEEEDFYKEYENKFSPSRPQHADITITEKSSNIRSEEQKRQDDAPKNRKVELAKAGDEALIDRNAGASDTTGGPGGERISNLSDLQQTLEQIQRRNKEGPIEGYSIEGRDSDTLLPSEREGDVSETAGGPKRKVAEDNFMSNDQYLRILQKAEERLSEMMDSNSNSDPDIHQKIEKKTLVSNMSSLQERLNQIQRDASAKGSSDSELSSSGESPKPKYLDDDTLSEWEELDNQLQREAATNVSRKQSYPPLNLEDPTQDGILADREAILNSLQSQAADNSYDSNQALEMDSDGRSTISNPDYVDDDSFDPSAIPSEYKKFVSDYEITEDGGVFLSLEAYQEACNNANPDGSLNFGSGDKDNDSKNRQQSSTLKSALIDNEPPMAPYGDSGATLSRKDLSIKELAEEASFSLEYSRNNPEAQEELHRRLMKEFEAEEPTNNAFESELLLDPEKAFAFWNQEYMKERKVEVDELEDLLDQKMRELEKEEEDRKNEPRNPNSNSNSEGRPERSLDSQKQSYKGDQNIFFASKQERIDRKQMIERDRREHAKNIAKFYADSDENSSWDSTSESKEVEEMNSHESL